MEVVSKHNTMDDCWVIFNREVFDITNYIKCYHPGGSQILILGNNRDITKLYRSRHKNETIFNDKIFRNNYFLFMEPEYFWETEPIN